jgi:phosphate transport system permease protein/phosphate transport system substrate-binding protein
MSKIVHHHTLDMQNNYRPFWLIAGIFFTNKFATILEQTYAQITINAAGASFPFPLIDTWRVEYQNVKPDVNINYQSIGSGGGVKQFIEKTVDLTTDAPLNEEEEKKLLVQYIFLGILDCCSCYDLPQISDKELKLTGHIIASIYR